jgi:hypothetical protein
MMYASFFIQLAHQAEPDPSGVPVRTVLVIKGVSLAVCVIALTVTLLPQRSPAVEELR